jgi:hypothetical protein
VRLYHAGLVRRRRRNAIAQGSGRGRGSGRRGNSRRGREANDSDTEVVARDKTFAGVDAHGRIPRVDVAHRDTFSGRDSVADVSALYEVEFVTVARYPGLDRGRRADPIARRGRCRPTGRCHHAGG